MEKVCFLVCSSLSFALASCENHGFVMRIICHQAEALYGLPVFRDHSRESAAKAVTVAGLTETR